MRLTLKRLVLIVAAAAAAGFAVVFFGLYNVSARTGHLPGVGWLLHKTYEQSVSLRAPPEDEVPDLTAPGLAALGAGHFASACTFCHGRPDAPRPATAMAMNPRPPHILDLTGDLDAAELHWVIYEGVKMSGMPAWPANRKDEVWAMVAYLRALKAGNAPAMPSEASDARAFCASCHGRGGRGGAPVVPRLDIQTEPYLIQALTAYRAGHRDSGFMQDAARRVTEDDLAALARHYAARSPRPDTEGPTPDPDLAAQGEALARRGTDDVPACTACHGPDAPKMRPDTPRLAGQWVPYLDAQLRLWRKANRGGGSRANLMHKASADLSDADIAALSAWYATLAPE